MIESAAYDIIKQDGILEGRSLTVKDLLEVKFGIQGVKLYKRCKYFHNMEAVNRLIDVIKIADSLDEVTDFIDSE